jgi:hypothetical protein
MSGHVRRVVIVSLAVIGLLPFGAGAQGKARGEGFWVHRGRVAGAAAASQSAAAAAQATPRSPIRHLRAFSRFAADSDVLRATLRSAPREFARSAVTTVIPIPMPDGTYERVLVEESPIFSPELQAQYDSVRTYVARGMDDPTVTGRLDYTAAGFHAMLISSRGTVYVDPAADGSGEYVAYWRTDATGEPFHCETHAEDVLGDFAGLREMLARGDDDGSVGLFALNPAGGQLRTYRLAVSVTGEYTRFFDGDPPTAGTPNTVAQITTTMNRVTGIYERDLQIRLDVTTTRIFTDPDTDPFSSGDFRTENQTTLDANPGDANYDIGHVLHRRASGASGVANVGVCVTGAKARGFTSHVNPSGDPYDVDYVAHEIGHQFSGSHTWTSNQGSCSDAGQFQAASAYEPGSGSTIMAYAGICSPDNVQNNSDAYFHTRNYDQILTYRTVGNGSTCGTISNTGNNPPSINAGPNCTIPRNTPFTLTAVGSDPDGDAVNFLWEQFNLGTHGQTPAADNTTGPLFRSRPATSSPSRTFPRMEDILSGVATPWEVLPNVDRTLNFRVTARDNRAGGGGVDYDAMTVTVSGAPFAFTFPGAGSALECGGSATVQWTVGGGGVAPNVALRSSTNNGTTFGTLVASTANDGSHTIMVPRTLTTQGRMQLVPSEQCFFAVSPTFSIVDTLPPTITAPADIVAECTSPTGTPVPLGSATASDQCDLTPTVANNAPALFGLGVTIVQWTATDDTGNQGTDTQSVTVQDTTPPVISCNAPATILPSDAPVTFIASAEDACDAAPAAEVTAFRCYEVKPNGRIVDKRESCVVNFAGDSITVVNSGGVNTVVEWEVQATDASGNVGHETCAVQVVRK